jgi:sec-independent protein translocase protein TatA
MMASVAVPARPLASRHRWFEGEAIMFGNLGFGELMIIMVIVLVLFGAKRVPEISASFGKGIREFKRNLNDVESAVTGAVTGTVDQNRIEAPSALPPSRVAERGPDETRAEPKRLL